MKKHKLSICPLLFVEFTCLLFLSLIDFFLFYVKNSTKQRRKSSNMICAICGDKAIGYNYDALTCGSCRAFFRRNAFKDLSSLRCLSRQGQCQSFAHDTRRKCPKCRLERCFTVGMRKDFMTQELPIALNEIVVNGNWSIAENIRSIFVATFQRNQSKQSTYFDCSDNISILINWSYIVHESALRFVDFFRKIIEFEELNSNDRFILIKYNLFPIYPILKGFYYDYNQNGFDTSLNQDECAKRHRFFSICFGSEDNLQAFIDVVRLFVEITEQDSTIISLCLVIFTFYQGLSMNDNEPILNDTLKVNRAQSYYVNILWNYMINKWGEIESQKRFSQLILVLFRTQTTSKRLQEFFCNQIRTSNTIDKIAPLMQTVLQIS